MDLNITLTKTKNKFTSRCREPLFLWVRKILMVMDQTLKGRSHHDLVNSFAKKKFRRISENQPAYQSSSTRLKQGHHCPI
jgi:hypothetical protein